MSNRPVLLQRIDQMASLLRRDCYADLQFVPFSDHAPHYLAHHLEELLAHEQSLLAAAASREPILYSHSICRAFYGLGLNPRQRLLGELFLQNHPVPRQRIERDLAEYLPYLEPVEAGGDELWFPLRIVPVYELLLIADPLGSDDDARVFLHNDSIRMARHLCSRSDYRGKTVADIGTGSGILAAIAKRQGAARVVAVDINPRAVEYATASFAINDCASIDARTGSIESVVTEADVLIANPPYMTGRSALALNGGGRDGLDIPREFIRHAQAHGKHLVMILEVPSPDDAQRLSERLGTACSRRHVLRQFAGRQLTVLEFGPATARP